MLDLILLLAMTCVAEIDLQTSPDECVEMWSINAENADRKKMPLERHTLRFNAYWRNPRAQRARPWIPQLTVHADKPADWPKRRSWKRERERWIAYVEAAERFAVAHFKGETPIGVAAAAGADDYGGIPDDGKHADDAAPCGLARRVRRTIPGARQAYWDTAPCRVARRARRRGTLPAAVAAGGRL
jgi:hypothetical protein